MPPRPRRLDTTIELSSGSGSEHDSNDDDIIIGSPVVNRPHLISRLSVAEHTKRNQVVQALREQYGEEDSGLGVKAVTATENGQSVLKSLTINVIPQLLIPSRSSSKAQQFSILLFAGADSTEAHPLVAKKYSAFPAVRVRIEFSPGCRSATFSVSCPWLTKCFTKPLAAEMQKIYQANKRDVRAAIQWLETKGLASLDIVRQRGLCYVTPDITFKRAWHVCFDDPESVLVFFDAMEVKCAALAGAALVPAGAFECGICFDRRPSLAAVLFPDCKHFFCRECVGRDFSLKIAEGQVKDLTCLEQGCKSLANAENGDMVKSLVEKATFHRYCEMMSESYVDGSKLIVRCPRKECSAPMELIPDAPNDIRCLTCGQSFCTACKAASHRGSPCLTTKQKKEIRAQWNEANEKGREDLKKRYGADNVRSALEDAESEDWISKNAKKCPKCATPIEKINGCNKMACTSKGCNAYFCWICNMELPHENPYSHFNVQSATRCGGLLYQQFDVNGRAIPLAQPPALMPGGLQFNQPRNLDPNAIGIRPFPFGPGNFAVPLQPIPAPGYRPQTPPRRPAGPPNHHPRGQQPRRFLAPPADQPPAPAAPRFQHAAVADRLGQLAALRRDLEDMRRNVRFH